MYVIAVVAQTQGQRNRSVPKRYVEVYFKQFQKLTLFIAKNLNSFYMLQRLYLIDWAVGSDWGFTPKTQWYTLEHHNEDFDVKTMVIGSRAVDGKRLIERWSCRGGGVFQLPSLNYLIVFNKLPNQSVFLCISNLHFEVFVPKRLRIPLYGQFCMLIYQNLGLKTVVATEFLIRIQCAEYNITIKMFNRTLSQIY